MIHLSRLLIGIKHTRIFRFKDMSGHMADILISHKPEQFTRVRESQGREEIMLSDDRDLVLAKFNMDDWIFESTKKYAPDKNEYVEIDQNKTLNIATECLPIVSEVMDFDKDYQRIGIIFEFRLPKEEITKELSVGEFICNNFIQFNTPEQAGEGSFRLNYKMKSPGGGVIKSEKGFRNIIVKLNEDSGIDEEGQVAKCLLVSIDMQRIYEPLTDKIDIEDHFNFAKEHLMTVVLPELKNKGIEINYE